MCSVNKVFFFFVFILTLWLWSLIFHVLRLHSTLEKQVLFVDDLNLYSCNLQVSFLETQKIKLIVLCYN